MLRVKMATFSVRIIIMVTGTVKSNLVSTTSFLSEGSVFIPLEESYAMRQKHNHGLGIGMRALARDAVEKVVGTVG